MRGKQLAALLVCCLLIGLMHAQTPSHLFHDSENGLPSTQTFAVAQLSDGSIAVGTRLGLFLYDGEQFRQTIDTLGHRDYVCVVKLRASPNGNIWPHVLGGGVCYMDADTMRVPTFNAALDLGTYAKIINDYRLTEDSTIWYVQESHRTQVRTITTAGQIDSLLCPNDHDHNAAAHLFNVEGTPHYLGFICHREKRTQAWLAAQEKAWHGTGEILQRSPQGWTWQMLHMPEPFFPKKDYIKALETETKIWAGVENHVVEKDLESGEERVLKLAGRLLNIHQLKDGSIFLLTEKGIYFRLPNTERWEHHFEDCLATDLLEDHQGALWISTLNKGVLYIPSLFIRKLDFEPLLNCDVNDIDAFQGQLVVTTNRKDLHFLQAKGDQWESQYIPPEKNEFVYSRGSYLMPHGNDLYYGRSKYHAPSGKFTALKKQEIRSTAANSHEVYGLKDTSLFVFSSKRDIALPHTDRYRLRIWANDSIILIGSYNGTEGYLLPDGPYLEEAFPHASDARGELIYRIDRNTFLMAGRKGVFIINPDTVIRFGEHNGLTAQAIEDVVMQSPSVFWLATLRGINRLEFIDGQFNFDPIGIPEGLKPEFVHRLAIHHDTLFVATDNGIFFFDTRIARMPNQAYQLKLKSIHINDSLIASNEQFSVPPGKRNVHMRFEALTFQENSRVEYAYRLEGLHHDWVNSGEGYVSYYDLPPGEFTFQVKAKNRKGLWTDPAINLSISVPPTLVERLWFQVAAPIFGVLLLSGLAFWYFRQRDARRKSQYSYSSAQLQALGMQMNPHFLFNALNNIQALAYSGHHKKTNAFMARLALLTRKMLENSNKPLVSLEDELHNVEQYLSMEQIRFENKPFEWTIEIDQNLNTQRVQIPPMLLQPVVENSIWHGLLRLDGERILRINCSGNDRHFSISIRDNGVGMQQQQKDAKPSKPSISLKNIQQRISLYNQLNYGKASFETHSPYRESKGGTEVVFAFETSGAI